VIAHFHYVLVGAIVFNIFAGILLLVPEGDGSHAERHAGEVALLACFSSGFTSHSTQCTLWDSWGCRARFTPTSRIADGTRLKFLDFGGRNDPGIAVLIFACNLVHSYFKGREAGNDPWDAWTLEWAVPSPPPVYNFAADPVVHSRRPLWI